MRWPRVRDHLAVGASTGYMSAERGDWPAMASLAAQESIDVVELSALSEPELPALLSWLASGPALPFWWIGAHGPTKAREMPEPDLVGLLEVLAMHVDVIVLHPDTIEDLERYRSLGAKIAIENMDTRKPVGQRADDLREIFDVLPDARLCFDIAHLSVVDATMGEGREILDRFGSRLSHVHISSLDESCHHIALSERDEQRFGELLDRCRDVPWILEAPLQT
jgi:hypothetical protein